MNPCETCGSTSWRWLHDEDGSWEPGEVPIPICTDCGAEVSEGGDMKGRWPSVILFALESLGFWLLGIGVLWVWFHLLDLPEHNPLGKGMVSAYCFLIFSTSVYCGLGFGAWAYNLARFGRKEKP